MQSIPLSDIEKLLTSGWINLEVLDITRLIKPGEVVTVILSDAEFTVPSTVGSANILGSKQHLFDNGGMVKMRVLERS